MAFLGKGKKEDLLVLASELEIEIDANVTILAIKSAITKNSNYEEDFARELLSSIIEDRKKREQLEEKRRKDELEEKRRKDELEEKRRRDELEEQRRKADLEIEEQRRKFELEAEARRLEIEERKRVSEQEHELEKIRLEAQLKLKKDSHGDNVQNSYKDLQGLIHKFDIKEDINLYLTLFERQARRAEIPKELWVSYLLGLLPYEITQIISREPEEETQDYEYVKEILFKRFKLTPEKFRQLFIRHQKENESTWLDYYHELYNYFHGWISGLKIDTFDKLVDLMIADQLKKRAPQEFKEFYLDTWCDFNKPIQLAEKLEEFEDIKKTIKPKFSHNMMKTKTFQYSNQKSYSSPHRYVKHENRNENFKTEKKQFRDTVRDKSFDKRRPLKCYECNSTDHLRPQCPMIKRHPPNVVNNVDEEERVMELLKPYIVFGKVNGIKCEILRDTGATIDIVSKKYVLPDDMTGEHVWVQQPLDLTPTCLPVARIVLECELGNVITKAAIVANELDRGRYLLGNRTASLIEERRENKNLPAQVNSVQTRSQKRLEESKIESSKSIDNPEIVPSEEDEDIKGSAVLPDKQSDDPLVSLLKTDKEKFKECQRSCQDLKTLFEQAEKIHSGHVNKSNYVIKNELLLKRKVDKLGKENLLLVVPKEFRENLKIACHEGTSAHLGTTKTKDRLARNFYWPNCYKELEDFVKSCDPCQRAGKAGDKKKAPMKMVPIISEVFRRINIDAVGPLPVTQSGKKYILTAMCLASKYPDAVALEDISSTSIVDALLQIFSRMGFPKEIQHDQGTSFMSALTTEFLEKCGIKIIHSSVYHPQSNPIERFHRTIKRILRVLCLEAAPDWEPHIHAALFALRTITHESTGFSPSELVYGKNLRTPLTLLYEHWLQPEEEQNSVVEYVLNLLDRLKRCQILAVEKMEECQEKRKTYYDKNSVKREFKEGSQVLVLAPSPANKLAVQWHGPGKIESKISDTNYIVSLPNRKDKSQIYHVNLLKPYYSRSNVINLVEIDELKDPPDLEIEFPFIQSSPNVFNFSELVEKNKIEERLCKEQIQVLSELLGKYSEIFSNEPGLTNIVEHDIELISSKPIRARPYRMSPRQNEILKSEINKMLDNKIIEAGMSDYTSPMILVETPGRDPRPCIDYRRLNEITKTEYFPLPNIEERIEIVSSAKFITIIDLAKGYWQIPLSQNAQKLATFVTNFGCYRPLRMPFGLKNAPYFFCKMISELLQGMESFAIPYLDDIAIFSNSWESHLKHLDDVFRRIRKANLKIKPTKCVFAQEYVKYLGHMVGQGKRTPAELKVEAVKNFPVPTTKTEIRAFLGLSGYYRRYIPNYSIIAAPLTDKLKGKSRKEKIVWSEECDTAFKELKSKLSNQPVLYSPDYEKEFLLQTDASNEGIGIVLSQVDEEKNEHPILYLSRKFTESEKKFCTTEKECAAIVWAVKKLQCYLDGQKFKVQTDHNPLIWLNSNAGSNPRLMRWALALQPFNFELIHRKGSLHKNADILSRIPEQN